MSGNPPSRDFTLPNVEGQPPIAADRNAPCPGTVALELVHAPAGRPDHAVHVGRRDQHREDVAQPPHQIVAEFPAVIVFNEAQHASVPDAPNVHIGIYADTVQMSTGGAGGEYRNIDGHLMACVVGECLPTLPYDRAG
jgi:hypothetical protein